MTWVIYCGTRNSTDSRRKVTTVASFEPLFPEDRVIDPLVDRAARLISSSQELLAARGTPLAEALVPQLRAMNSYYTNKIEGQHTTPAKIEAALRREFDLDAAERTKQRYAVAHIVAQESLEAEWHAQPFGALFDRDHITTIHDRFFAQLSLDERLTPEGQLIVPGEFRDADVVVGRHRAPAPEMVGPLIDRLATRYGKIRGREHQVIALVCAHHRLTWIHPFFDGNGRVARLHSHLGLKAAELTHDLWSPLRGLAREHEQYFARLSEADQTRRNDLDGRGNLTQEGLVRFAAFFLDCCVDQVDFMIRMTEFKGVRQRLVDFLRYLDANPWALGSECSVIKPEVSALALEFVALQRSVSRAEFAQILGGSAVLARRITRTLLDVGLLKSTSHRGQLSFGLPLSSLRFLFPRLWPEVEQS